HMAIDQLVAAGKLSLDDKLGKFLPDYPNQEAREKVTVKQLVDMTSGIGDFFGERYMQTPKEKLRSLADYLPLFADKPLLFPPGTQERYSNGGYVVLGLIIEKVSGQSYYEYVKQHIFAPAGMSDSDSYFSDEKVANRAEGYSKRNGTPDWANNADSRPARGSSAGGGYSTAPDLLKLTQAMAAGRFPTYKDGLGVAGGAPGINAALLFNPQKGYAIIVLGNYDPPAAERVAQQIRAWMQSI
ncbi:MAG TPA: serine hydrolase domain-containing protein, partial [Terriglobales bacterium]|nr:serine hydrolase domain-containing protein [Terriglobales bacterium]